MNQNQSKNKYREDFLKILAEVEDTYYKTDDVPEINKFIEEYNPNNDYSRICFSWDSGLGAKCKDSNQEFREKISIFICLHNDIRVSELLLRDIIQEIGRESQASWGAPEYLFLLSERLLRETGGKYIETFGEMLFRNMDTYGACISIDFTDIDIESILNELNQKECNDRSITNLIEYFEAQL